jgi:hypothetical protein
MECCMDGRVALITGGSRGLVPFAWRKGGCWVAP